MRHDVVLLDVLLPVEELHHVASLASVCFIRERRLSRLADSGRPGVVGAKSLTFGGYVWWPATRKGSLWDLWGRARLYGLSPARSELGPTSS